MPVGSGLWTLELVVGMPGLAAGAAVVAASRAPVAQPVGIGLSRHLGGVAEICARSLKAAHCSLEVVEVSTGVVDVLAHFTFKVPQTCQGLRVTAFRRGRLKLYDQGVQVGHLALYLRSQVAVHLFQEIIM